VINSGSQFRLQAPPDKEATRNELRAMASVDRSAEAVKKVRYWDAGSPSYRWVQTLQKRITDRPIGNPQTTRAFALMNIAIYDAMIAAWDTKYTYQRERPTSADRSLNALVSVPDSPSYPCERAVAAGAASAILAYLFPTEAQQYLGMSQEAAQSRVAAGVQYPSDVAAGLDLGRRVAEQVIERAKRDGSDLPWTGVVPQGPGMWTGTNPVSPTHGQWKTWVLLSGNQFRPDAPPAFDSTQKLAELQEVKNAVRDFNSTARSFYYQTPDGIFSYWYDYAHRQIFESGLEQNPPRAARIYALTSISHYEASVACWDAKYTYWAARPFMLDSKVTTLFTTPNHPSYPAAHGCYSGAIAATLGALFPDDALFINTKADEAAMSRLTGGIHFRSDLDAGLKLGRTVSKAVLDRAAEDRSDVR
jgi:hypothetical protein